MRTSPLFTATVLPLLFGTACALSSDQTNDPILGECGESTCDGGENEHGEDTCGSDTCGGDDGGGGGGGGGVDVDLDLEVDANLDIEVIGTGIYVGVFPLGCLDLSGQFSAHASASASLNGDTFVIASVDAAAAIELGNGCSCSGIDVSAIAAIHVSASIDASTDSCKLACDGKDNACEQTCNAPGNKIVATASLDASASAAVSVGGALDLEALVGAEVALDLTAVVDAHGQVLVEL